MTGKKTKETKTAMGIEEYQPPTQAALEYEALNFVKINKPRYYKDLKKTGKLKEHCQRRATKAMSYAKSLISNGMSEREAWDMAMRQILELKSDCITGIQQFNN
jgi:hypothetical protein